MADQNVNAQRAKDDALADKAASDIMQKKNAVDGKKLDLLEINDDEEALSLDSAFDPRLAEMVTPAGSRDLEAVYNVPVRVTAVLGVSKIRVADLLRMRRGTVVELDRKIGEAIDIYVNDRLVARGEVVVVENHLGITMTEIIKSDQF